MMDDTNTQIQEVQETPRKRNIKETYSHSNGRKLRHEENIEGSQRTKTPHL